MLRIVAGALALLLIAPLASSAASPPATSSLATSYAQFGFDTLRMLHAAKPTSNVFISPASIATALALVANGAGGTTRSDMLRTLHFTGSINAFDTSNAALAHEMATTTAVKLTMANALWLQNGFIAKSQFVSVAYRVFGAKIGNLNFRSPSAAAVVNAWAKSHTKGLIPKVVDTIDPSTVAMIANAIAFDGKWTAPFDPKQTHPHEFNAGWTTTTEVPLMMGNGRYEYTDGAGLQTIRLPYADGSFAMYVVLAKDAPTLDAFVKDTSAASFSKLRASMTMQKGNIGLPRFSVRYAMSLNNTLKSLGMQRAFSRGADFSNLHEAPPPLAISDVQHASFLKVDEAGTQAAAATTVGIHVTSIQFGPPPFSMIVDHPFFVAIRDEKSGQLLFIGTIARP